MFKTILFAGVVALSAAKTHPINEEIVAEIKARTSIWRPYEVANNPLAQLSVEDIEALANTELSFPDDLEIDTAVSGEFTAPRNFDGRDAFGKCIHPIRNQRHCGSCWAFGASESLSDRFCIATKGAIDVVLSPQDLVSCDKGNMACGGGWLNVAFQHLERVGDRSDECVPYTAGGGQVEACPSTCTGSGSNRYYKCASGSTVVKGGEAIKQEIYNNGPMETGFAVFQDFYNYYDGVYEHVTGGQVGGHAVKMLGWGVENGTPYWLCANSWGPNWAGLNGFFKIKQGDCNVDRAVYGCTPKTDQEFYPEGALF